MKNTWLAIVASALFQGCDRSHHADPVPTSESTGEICEPLSVSIRRPLSDTASLRAPKYEISVAGSPLRNEQGDAAAGPVDVAYSIRRHAAGKRMTALKLDVPSGEHMSMYFHVSDAAAVEGVERIVVADESFDVPIRIDMTKTARGEHRFCMFFRVYLPFDGLIRELTERLAGSRDPAVILIVESGIPIADVARVVSRFRQTGAKRVYVLE